jgi:hypothetical protein
MSWWRVKTLEVAGLRMEGKTEIDVNFGKEDADG